MKTVPMGLRFGLAMMTSLTAITGLAGQAKAIISASGEVTYDFTAVSGTISPARTPADVRVGRTARGSLTVNGGSRLRMDSGGGFDPFLVIGRRPGSGGSSVLIDNGAIDLPGRDIAGGINVQVGRDSFGRMTIRNGGELNLVNPDAGNFDIGGAALSVGRSRGGGELLLDNGSVRLDSDVSSFLIGREGATARVDVRNGSTIVVDEDGSIDPSAGGNIAVGRSGTADASMIVDGSRVLVRSNNVARIFVGREQATGRLEVSDSTIDIVGPDAGLVVGDADGSTGRVRFDRGSIVSIGDGDSDLEIARVAGADGGLVIEGGAVVEVSGLDGDARVAADLTGFGSSNDGGVGRLEVRGAGSRLRVQDSVITGSPLSFGGTGSPSAAIVVAERGVIEAERVIVGRGASLTGSEGLVAGNVFNDGGLIAPGSSPGTLTVGSFEQTAGTLLVEVAGLGAGEFDVLEVLGDAVFSGGTIAFSFIDDFLPSAGDIIPFLTAAGSLGIADTDFTVSGVAAGFDFSVSAQNGVLALFANSDAVAVPEAPALWTLLVGLLGIGLLASRRRHQSSLRLAPSPVRQCRIRYR